MCACPFASSCSHFHDAQCIIVSTIFSDIGPYTFDKWALHFNAIPQTHNEKVKEKRGRKDTKDYYFLNGSASALFTHTHTSTSTWCNVAPYLNLSNNHRQSFLTNFKHRPNRISHFLLLASSIETVRRKKNYLKTKRRRLMRVRTVHKKKTERKPF